MSLNTNDIQFNYVCRFDKTLKFITKNGCDKKIETVKESDVFNGKCFGCPGPLDIENEEEKKIEINYNVVEKASLPGMKIEKKYVNQDENKEDSPLESISVHDRYMEKEEIKETYNKIVENKKGCEKEMVENNEVEKEEVLIEKKEKKNNYKKKCKNESCATMISTYGRKTGLCLPCYNDTKKVEAEKKKEAVKVMDEVLKGGEKESLVKKCGNCGWYDNHKHRCYRNNPDHYNVSASMKAHHKCQWKPILVCNRCGKNSVLRRTDKNELKTICIPCDNYIEENDHEARIKFCVDKCEQYDKELKEKDDLIKQQKETIFFLNNKNKEKKEFIEKELGFVKESLHEKQVLLDFSDKSFDETFKFIKEAAEKDLRTVENEILHYLRELGDWIKEYCSEKWFDRMYVSNLDKWELSREIIKEFKKEFNK
jgi:hypothetical protein